MKMHCKMYGIMKIEVIRISQNQLLMNRDNTILSFPAPQCKIHNEYLIIIW